MKKVALSRNKEGIGKIRIHVTTHLISCVYRVLHKSSRQGFPIIGDTINRWNKLVTQETPKR